MGELGGLLAGGVAGGADWQPFASSSAASKTPILKVTGMSTAAAWA